MKEFDKICREIEEMDPDLLDGVLANLASDILPALEEITEDGSSAVTILSTFILGSVVADGKIAEEEFLLIHPLYKSFFGKDLDLEGCKKLLKKYKQESKELKTLTNLMADVFGELSEQLKTDIVSACLIICAVDGKISGKEKKWIKQLAE